MPGGSKHLQALLLLRMLTYADVCYVRGRMLTYVC
jgi:hypothetical protein